MAPKAGYGPKFIYLDGALYRIDSGRLIAVERVACPEPGSARHKAEWARDNGWPDCDKVARVNHWIDEAHHLAHGRSG
jgi:hypothetical protein